MESLRPIFWGQGMFLQPQHFQQQDCYHEARLWHYLRLLYPFCWGVKSLAISETALRNFVFEVEHCELVTWDGTIIHYRGGNLPSNARLERRSFEDALDPGGRPLGVYLGLKRLQWEENNVDSRGERGGDARGADTHRRFRIDELTTPDLFGSDGQPCSLKYLVHEAQILFEQEISQRQDHELIKLGELLRSAGSQGAVLSKQYIPPSLSVHSSPLLEGMLREIRDLLTAKGRELSEYKRQRGIQTNAIGSRDAFQLLMMQTLNRYIPLFHHYLQMEETHPCLLYALLRQLVGELSTFSETVSALGELPSYRHDQLWECFNAAGELTKELLNELGEAPGYAVPLIFREKYFTADLEKVFFGGDKRYYLSVRADIPARDLVQRLRAVKVSCREEMATLIEKALPGVRLDYLENPPDVLPQTRLCSYFKIEPQGLRWSKIAECQNIAVYCQLLPQGTQMQVVVISET